MLVTLHVPENLFPLLREVLEKRAPELLVSLRETSKVVIPEEERGTIQDLIGEEICETGLRGDEPNRRGLDLETLIDVFSPYK